MREALDADRDELMHNSENINRMYKYLLEKLKHTKRDSGQ